LTKPCETPTLKKAIDAGIRQYNLLHSEKILLDKTLNGTLQVLLDVLSLAKPEVFGKASRIKEMNLRLIIFERLKLQQFYRRLV